METTNYTRLDKRRQTLKDMTIFIAYIKNYTIQTFVTVLAGLGYLIGSHTYYKYSKKNKNRDITQQRVKIAYIVSVIAWVVLSVLKLELMK